MRLVSQGAYLLCAERIMSDEEVKVIFIFLKYMYKYML